MPGRESGWDPNCNDKSKFIGFAMQNKVKSHFTPRNSVEPTSKQIFKKIAYFPWWANGPYSSGLGSCAGVIDQAQPLLASNTAMLPVQHVNLCNRTNSRRHPKLAWRVASEIQRSGERILAELRAHCECNITSMGPCFAKNGNSPTNRG